MLYDSSIDRICVNKIVAQFEQSVDVLLFIPKYLRIVISNKTSVESNILVGERLNCFHSVHQLCADNRAGRFCGNNSFFLFSK